MWKVTMSGRIREILSIVLPTSRVKTIGRSAFIIIEIKYQVSEWIIQEN